MSTDLISTFGAENTLNACYFSNDQEACARINRNPANGALWIGDGNVEDLNINVGGLQTSRRRPEPELHRRGRSAAWAA